MNAARARNLAATVVPGAEWEASEWMLSIQIAATFPDGSQASFHHCPRTDSPLAQIDECLAVSREAWNLGLAWVDGVLR